MGLFDIFHREASPLQKLVKGLQTNDLDLCTEALKDGADPNVTLDQRGFTPLHFASGKGYATIAQALIDHGADVNYQNPVIRGQSHLLLSLIYSHIDVAEILLQAGADPNRGWGLTQPETPPCFVKNRAKTRASQAAFRVLDDRMITLLEAHGGKERPFLPSC